MYKLGLALSGGGTRGMVHIGALKAFEEAGIRPDILSGTSAGSIIGALYSKGYAPEEMIEIAKGQSLFKLVGWRMPSKGFVAHKHLRKILEKHLGTGGFDELKIPFYVAVANLHTGQPEVWKSGPLIELIIASSSIPVMFEPVQIEGSLYVDGGLLMNMPAMPIRPLCDILVGINLVPRVHVGDEELSSMITVGGRCFDLSALNNIKPHLSVCDVVIEPEAIHSYSRFNFSDFDKMFEIGYEETKRKLPAIMDMLKNDRQVSQST